MKLDTLFRKVYASTICKWTCLVSLILLGCGTGLEGRKNFQPRYRESDKCIYARIERGVLVFPLAWWKAYFKYDNLDCSETCEASEIFLFAVTQPSGMLRIADSSGSFKLGEFFKEFKPRNVERLRMASFDTIRTNRKGELIHVHDMSVYYSIFLPDTSLQNAIEKLMRIPGVSSVQRTVEMFPDGENSL